MVVQCNVHPSRTLEKLNKQRLASSFTDVTVIVSGQHFSVHKALLAAHSSVFCTVLQDSSLSQTTPNINLDGVESEYFSIILDFIYTSKLCATPTNVDQLHSTALFLQMQEVIDLCNKFKFSQKEVTDPIIHEVVVRLGDERKSETEKDSEILKQTMNTDEIQFQDKDSNNMMVEVFRSSEMEDVIDDRSQRDEEYIDVIQQSTNNSMGTKKLKKRGRKPQKRVTCEVCSRVMTKTKYEIHKRMHTGEKPYSCNDCGKQFVSIHNQRIHERIHTGERPYHCNLCDKAFADPSTIRKHRLWHAGVKNKLCGMCGKYFATLTQVREHMRTHTKEKPYVCTECDKAYRYRCDLKRHMTEHTGNLIGPCNECGKYFNHRGNFLSHLRTHRKRNNSPLKLQDSGLVTSDGRIILKAKICDEALASAMLVVPAQQQSGSHRNVHDATNQQSSSGMTSQNHQDSTSSDVLKVHDLSQTVTDGGIEVTINNGKFYVNQTRSGLSEENGFLSESANEIILKEEDDITVATATASTSSQGQLFGQQCETSLTADHVLMLVQDTQNLSEIRPSSKNANPHSRNDIIITDEHDESLVIVDPNMT